MQLPLRQHEPKTGCCGQRAGVQGWLGKKSEALGHWLCGTIAQPPPQALQQAPNGGWMQGLGLQPVAEVMIWPLHWVPGRNGKQLPLTSQQTCGTGGQGLGLQLVTGVHPAGHGTIVTHAPVLGSQQPGSGHGFGLQVVPLITVPWQTVPTTTGVQLPAASQQTFAGGGQGLGTQTCAVRTVQPGGQPVVVASVQLPVTGSQQTRPRGLQGLGLHVPETTIDPGGQVPAAEIEAHTPVVVSQQTCDAGGQGFGLQVVAEKIWPLQGVPGVHGEQLPAESQQTCVITGGQGFGRQLVAVRIWPLHGVPAIQGEQLPCWSQQTPDGVRHGLFGVQVLPGPPGVPPMRPQKNASMNVQVDEFGQQQACGTRLNVQLAAVQEVFGNQTDPMFAQLLIAEMMQLEGEQQAPKTMLLQVAAVHTEPVPWNAPP